MKTFKIILFSALFIVLATVGFAQAKSESFKVAGECGTCKKKIESGAKKAGATYASWSVDTKILTVKYNTTATNKAKIEKAIAAVGYDTPDYKATDASYNNLDDCCQYERANATSCCDNAKCTEAACFKDGKCAKDMSCCKEAGCDKKACCQKS